MKKQLHIIFLIALMIIPGLAFSQFTVSAELRPRAEMDNGLFKPKADTLSTNYFVSQRTRLKFSLKKEKYQLMLSVQDVRFWGSGDIYSSTGVFGSTGGVDLQEAWLKLKLCEYSWLTIGRQALKVDGQRLVAARNWNQFGVAYDALRYEFMKNKWALNVVLSYNTNRELMNGKLIQDDELFNVKNLMKTQNYIHLSRKFSDKFYVSFITLASGYQHTTNPSVIYMMATYGFYLKYTSKVFDIEANLYGQAGKAQSGKDVRAFMLTLHPGVKFNKIRIGVGADYLSGDNAEDDTYGEKEKTFNQMYGAGFKYYGNMNYFTYMKSSTRNGGLVDLYPNIMVPVKQKHVINLAYHRFWLANPVAMGEGIEDDLDLGSEIDLMYTYKAMKELSVQAGFTYYLTSETLESIKGVGGAEIRSPYWAWVMVTFKPELFSK